MPQPRQMREVAVHVPSLRSDGVRQRHQRHTRTIASGIVGRGIAWPCPFRSILRLFPYAIMLIFGRWPAAIAEVAYLCQGWLFCSLGSNFRNFVVGPSVALMAS